MPHLWIAYVPIAIICTVLTVAGIFAWRSKGGRSPITLVTFTLAVAVGMFVVVDFYGRVRPFLVSIEYLCQTAIENKIDRLQLLTQEPKSILIGKKFACNAGCAARILNEFRDKEVFSEIEDAKSLSGIFPRELSVLVGDVRQTHVVRYVVAKDICTKIDQSCVQSQLVARDTISPNIALTLETKLIYIRGNLLRSSEYFVISSEKLLFRQQSYSFEDDTSYAAHFFLGDGFANEKYHCQLPSFSALSLLKHVQTEMRTK